MNSLQFNLIVSQNTHNRLNAIAFERHKNNDIFHTRLLVTSFLVSFILLMLFELRKMKKPHSIE